MAVADPASQLSADGIQATDRATLNTNTDVRHGFKARDMTGSGVLGAANQLIRLDSSIVAVTLTLLPASDCTGRSYVVVADDISSTTKVVVDSSANSILSKGSVDFEFVFSTQYEAVRLWSDGTDWYLWPLN